MRKPESSLPIQHERRPGAGVGETGKCGDLALGSWQSHTSSILLLLPGMHGAVDKCQLGLAKRLRSRHALVEVSIVELTGHAHGCFVPDLPLCRDDSTGTGEHEGPRHVEDSLGA